MQTPEALSTSCSIPCSIFFGEYVTTLQSNYIVFFQECFEISAFCKYKCSYLQKPLVHMNVKGAFFCVPTC